MQATDTTTVVPVEWECERYERPAGTPPHSLLGLRPALYIKAHRAQ